VIISYTAVAYNGYERRLHVRGVERLALMAEKKVPGTVHIHVDDINSLKFKTLLTYCGALHYKYDVQSHKDIRRSMRPKVVTGEPRIFTDEVD
jgi:hypothetical protein